jgi:hypothetical protein
MAMQCKYLGLPLGLTRHLQDKRDCACITFYIYQPVYVCAKLCHLLNM